MTVTLCPTCGQPLRPTEHDAYQICGTCMRFWTTAELTEAQAARAPLGTTQALMPGLDAAPPRYDPLATERPRKRKPRSADQVRPKPTR